MGDTVWYDEVRDVLNKYTPDVVVINTGNAQFVYGRSVPSKDSFKVIFHKLSTFVCIWFKLNPTHSISPEVSKVIQIKPKASLIY